jgi:alpha-beta hydrolase superfamily lysophospholipase
MGGAIVGAYLENGSNTAAVTHTVLVSPAMSFHEVTVFGAERIGIPNDSLAPVIWLAERFVELRSLIDYDASEFIDNAATWPVPALVTAVSEDDLVPPDSIEAFAGDLPEGTFKLFDGAFHTGELNKDSTTFDDLVTTWLDDQLADTTG